MTDYETLKDRIWDDARADKRDLFNKDCEALMEKSAQDIWRIGWNIAPNRVEDVYELLDKAAKFCHDKWVEAVKCGDVPVPPEDVSPGDGFALAIDVIKKAIEEAKSEKDCDQSGETDKGMHGRRVRSAATILSELVAAIKSLEDSREMELGFIEACGTNDAYMSEKEKREYEFVKDTVTVDEKSVRRLIREAKFCCK